MNRDEIDEMNENPLPELETSSGKPARKAKKAKAKKDAPKKAPKKAAAKKPAKPAPKATKPTKAAKATKKAAPTGDRSHGRGALRDVDGMLTRMGARLSNEHTRLVNTAKRAASHGDAAGAKRASKLGDKLVKLIAEFQ